jgi:U3 small nucleolar RNA-associated protein 15
MILTFFISLTSPIPYIQHGQPIECCKMTPSGALALTAGGNEIKVWDILSGGKLLHTFSNHQKNVTDMAFDGTSSRLLSCGLDGHVKVYSLTAMQVMHGMRFGSPLMSLAISADNKKLVVGYVDGNLMVRSRPLEADGSLGLGVASVCQKQQGRFYKGTFVT